VVAGLALAGCGGASERGAENAAGAKVTTTPEGTLIATRIDRRRGLVFELQTSTMLGVSNGLYVRLTKTAPAGTRRALLHNPLAATCDVPGSTIREFPGHWDHRLGRFGTALLADPEEVVMVGRATTCALWVGQPGDVEDIAVFPDDEFSRVRMR